MRFRHPRGVRLALLSGHVAHVGKEWGELDARFQQEAMLKGCEVEQNIIPAATQEKPKASSEAVVNTDETSVVRRALQAMLERDVAGDFTSQNLPNIKAVEKLAGIQVNKGEVYRIFKLMKAEANAPTGAGTGEGVADGGQVGVE